MLTEKSCYCTSKCDKYDHPTKPGNETTHNDRNANSALEEGVLPPPFFLVCTETTRGCLSRKSYAVTDLCNIKKCDILYIKKCSCISSNISPAEETDATFVPY